MTATDELRRMLDERGVKWRRTPHYSSESIDNETVYRGDGIEWIANDHLNGNIGLRALRYQVTPEQAIAATLGREDTYTREDVEGAFVSGYSLGCLPVGSDPTWDENRQTVDEHMAEWGWVRAATLGAGTCHEVEDEDTGFIVCSECGAVHDESYTSYYCWCCGRKVVDG